MAKLYPLRFEPLFRRYIWGGQRLGTVLGKPIGEGDDFAESWEVVDHGADQSVVANGPLAGTTLHELVTQRGVELFWRHAPQPSFPLLFKFLDAHRTLSVQVHPNDEQAANLVPPDLGKTEAWVVLASEPGSLIYAGLKSGVGRAELAKAIAAGECEKCLHSFEPQVGDCVFIPAGTVHALGAGLVIAEIQQASDTTFRLFDWNRVDASGKPRSLHVKQALDVIDFDRGPVAVQTPRCLSDGSKVSERVQAIAKQHGVTALPSPTIERLVTCDKFVLDRWRFEYPSSLLTDKRFRLLAVLEGEVTSTYGDKSELVPAGSTVLVPAVCKSVPLFPMSADRESEPSFPSGPVTLLDIYLPD